MFDELNTNTENSSNLSNDEWNRPALASCQTLKFIGIYLIFVFLLGILLNGYILFNLFARKQSNSPIRIFMIALSVSELLASVAGIPLPLLSNFACR